MLSKKSAGDLEACSALGKQVLNASQIILDEFAPFHTV